MSNTDAKTVTEKIPARWRYLADGTEHKNKAELLKHVAKVELANGIQVAIPRLAESSNTVAEIVDYLASNADSVLAKLKLHATPKKRGPRATKSETKAPAKDAVAKTDKKGS